MTSAVLFQDQQKPRVVISITRRQEIRRRWNLKWGMKLGFRTIEEYAASIPEPEECLQEAATTSYSRLVLVDPRMDLGFMCETLYVNHTFLSTLRDDPGYSWPTTPYWISVHDGAYQRDVNVKRWRASASVNEVGLRLIEAISMYAQYPQIVDSHHIVCPSSIRPGREQHVATLGKNNRQVEVNYYHVGCSTEDYGIASALKRTS